MTDVGYVDPFIATCPFCHEPPGRMCLSNATRFGHRNVKKRAHVLRETAAAAVEFRQRKESIMEVRTTVEVVREDDLAWHTLCIVKSCNNVVSNPKRVMPSNTNVWQDAENGPRVCAAHPMTTAQAAYIAFRAAQT